MLTFDSFRFLAVAKIQSNDENNIFVFYVLHSTKGLAPLPFRCQHAHTICHFCIAGKPQK